MVLRCERRLLCFALAALVLGQDQAKESIDGGPGGIVQRLLTRALAASLSRDIRLDGMTLSKPCRPCRSSPSASQKLVSQPFRTHAAPLEPTVPIKVYQEPEALSPQKVGMALLLLRMLSNEGNMSTTYGEITRDGLKVFKPFYRRSAKNFFLDLGSGHANSLLQFYSLFPFPASTVSVTGIEFLQERHNVAVANIRAVMPGAPQPASDTEYHYGPFHLYCGNFFDSRFNATIDQANLVYVANLCFPNETNAKIHDRLRGNDNAVVVSCKQLSLVGSMPTTLNQSWDSKGQGHIWEVGAKDPVPSDAPLLGPYILDQIVDVSDVECRGDVEQDIARLLAGTRVQVLHARLSAAGDRWLGLISEPMGWIPLVDRITGYRWAHRDLPS